MTTTTTPVKSEIQRRFLPIDETKVDKNSLTFSFSSEAPVTRYFGDEVLDHEQKSVDLTRLNNNAAPLLFNHDPNIVLGKVSKAWIDGKRGMATIKWATNTKAKEVRADVEAGILESISVGYVVNEMEPDTEGDAMRATSWSPHELSIVSIPADQSVGINRSLPFSFPTPKDPLTDMSYVTQDLDKIASDRSGSLPLDPQEQQRYSLINMVKAVVSNDYSNAGFERECSAAIEQQTGKRARGFYIPTNLQVRTPYITTTATAAGNLVGTNLDGSNFIDALRKSLKVFELGATVLSGNVGNLDVPRQSGLTSTYWVAEGSNITESNATFDKISLTPKTIGALSSWTRIQELQATPDLEQLVRNDLTQQVAAAIDLACIAGTGSSNQPIGILNQSGTNSVVGGTNGAAVTYDHLADLIAAVSQDSADAGRTGFLTNNQVLTKLLKTKDSDGNYLLGPGSMVAGSPATLWGRTCEISQQVPSNLTKGSASGTCSAIIYGNWADLVVAQWGSPLDILVNPFGSSYAAGNVEIRAMSSLDLGLRHPESFAVMKDALTA